MTSSEEEEHITIKEENIEEISPWKKNSRRSVSAFSPYKPVTILTNLQRGNIETQTIQVLPEEVSFHNKAAMGEILVEDFTPDIDVNDKDENGLTPLIWAAAYGQLPTVKLLLQHNANVDAEGEDGETALLLAATGGHHEVVRLLISFGANPNHVDHFGNTALMYAVNSDHAHSVSELIENGADVTMTNSSGASAFNLAVNKGCKRAQIVLERFLLRLLEPS